MTPVDTEKISVELLDFALWKSGMFASPNKPASLSPTPFEASYAGYSERLQPDVRARIITCKAQMK